ncbi:MAG: hypothetical protein U5O39_07815 [Gammaproteobacteria bacterium]|nr:hypothetical protein [Gammaproteobacteria bacterium]
MANTSVVTPRQLLPNETFSDYRRLAVGDKHISLLWPGRGHTDGDLVALFEEEGVIHMGDLYFNRLYPNIDLEAGGSVQAWSATIDRVSELDFDRVIPGHGEVSDPAGVRRFQDFIVQLAELGTEAIKDGVPRRSSRKRTLLPRTPVTRRYGCWCLSASIGNSCSVVRGKKPPRLARIVYERQMETRRCPDLVHHRQ